MLKKIDGQHPETFPTNTAENHYQLPPTEDKQALAAKPTDAEQIGQPSIRESTSPRTEIGKKRSSRNAIKFGILSRATLLRCESRSDYQSLLEGLREALQPEWIARKAENEGQRTISSRTRLEHCRLKRSGVNYRSTGGQDVTSRYQPN
jgi:hypothetical protein